MKKTKVVEKEDKTKSGTLKTQEEIEIDIATRLHELCGSYNHDSFKVCQFLKEKKSYWEIRSFAENCENNEALRKMLTDAIHTALDERG